MRSSSHEPATPRWTSSGSVVRSPSDERERLFDLLQEATLTVIGDDSPLLVGTTPEQLALTLAEAARCGVVVVPTDGDGTAPRGAA